MKRKKRFLVMAFSLVLVVACTVGLSIRHNTTVSEEQNALKEVHEEPEISQSSEDNEKINEVAAGPEEQQVKMSIMQKPKIDIVLARSRTKADVSQFKEKLFAELENLNIDTDYVNIMASEMEIVENKGDFTWQEDVSSSIGSITLKNNGQDVTMVGNGSNEGKNALWIIPEKNQEQTFTFHYKIEFGDSFNAAGMLLRVKQSGDTLTGYALSFNQPSYDWYNDSNSSNGALWKITYKTGRNSSIVENRTLVKELNIQTEGDLTVQATDSKITVSGGGLDTPVEYPIPLSDTDIGYGYGFFSEHYSHSCNEKGSFALTGINLQTLDIKSFTEVLKEPEWRDEAYKFLVDVDDTQNEELLDSSRYAEVLSRLLNDTIYFVSWGVTLNESEFEGLIEDNDTHGKFFTNTQEDLYKATAQYIKDVIGELTDSNYVIVNEPLDITIDPVEFQSSTVDGTWPNGKWRVDHNYTYFENDMGQFVDSGKYLDQFINVFDKVGEFNITFRDQSIIPEHVYVHRRPVAVIDMEIDGTSVTLGDSNSYDLDKFSETNKGISEVEWRYFVVEDGTWTDGKLTTIDPAKHYVVQLKVKDLQNAWSEVQTVNIGDGKPVARFDITTSPITKYMSDVTYVDSSYDPQGKELTTYLWEVYSEDGTSQVYTGSDPKVDFTDVEPGKYKVYLTVTNSDQVSSERFCRNIEVFDDTIAPEVIIDPTECEWVKSTNVNVKFTDAGGSGFKSFKYITNTDQNAPSSDSDYVYNSTSSDQTINISNVSGNYYLHIIADDNAGNTSVDRVTGIYKIDNTAPTFNYSIVPDDITTGTVEITINPSDAHSGVAHVYFDDSEEELTAGEDGKYKKTVSKNKSGYKVKIVDKVGNEYIQDIDITNIYKECTAGLDHPNYPSELEKCPICALIEGMQITKESNVYDAQDHRVEYTNPQNATIHEYYDGNKSPLPNDVKEYSYELKVEYQGAEYKTGLVGTYTVTKKEITITNIDATDRPYNKQREVNIFGGTLQGVEEGDSVSFTLPQTGLSESEKVGTHYVTIGEITLTGPDANNYSLKQPAKEDVDVQITKKRITITGVDAKDREYDKTKEVELFGGELNGVEQGDEVGFTLPQNGTSDSEKVGTYNVTVPEITLNGADASNYELEQPQHTDVGVEIKKRKVRVEDLDAVDRKYDKSDKVKLKGSKLDKKIEGDDVEAVVPETGISENSDIGTWRVELDEIELVGEDASNYEIVQPEYGEVDVEILRPDQPLMHINSYVTEINGEVWPPVVEEEEETPPDVQDEDVKEPEEEKEPEPEPEEPEVVLPEVRLGDIVKIKIDIVNDGVGAGYIENVKVNIPEGLEYIEEDETNALYNWETEDRGLLEKVFGDDSAVEEEKGIEYTLYESKMYAFDKGTANELTTTQSRSLELVFKVTQEEMIEDNLFIETEVEQKDIRNEAIPYSTEVNKSVVELYMAYTDFVADLSVKEIINDATGEKVDFKEEEDFVYFEMPEADVENTLYRVVYNVNVKNDGKSLGETDKVYGYLPEDVEFPQEENENWTVVPNTNMVYNENYSGIEGYSSENQELVVYWNTANGNTIGKEANMLILATDDIDQRKIQEVPYETVDLEDADVKEIEKTNNVDDAKIADIFINVDTSDIPVVPIAIVFGISLVGIVAIIVVKSRQKSNN